MKIVFQSYYYDSDLNTESELLHRYRSTTEWCKAVLQAGAESIAVVQRFHRDSTVVHEGITYHFVADGLGTITTPFDTFNRLHEKAAAMKPDIVHHNGWAYPLLSLRKFLPTTTAIIWQHHGGGIPRLYSQFFYRTGFQAVDSFIFTSKKIAAPWKQLNLINQFHEVHEVIESSSTFQAKEREECRKRLKLSGKELFLWVGRLDQNKDPITVLTGFKEVINELEDPHLYMIFHEVELLNDVKEFISLHRLEAHVHLLGKQPHPLLEEYYSAADYFVLGSHHEGSGFALLEALACGVTPIITDIPSFNTITNGGEIGNLWNVGNANSFADATRKAVEQKQSRQTICIFFYRTLSYEALGKQALAAYQETHSKRNSGKKKIAVVVPGGIDSPESGLHIPTLVQLLEKLSRSYDMTIYSLIRISKDQKEYTCGDARVVFLGSNHEYTFLSKLRLLLKTLVQDAGRFDLIHGLWGMPTGFAAVIVSKLFGIPSIVSLLGGETANIPEIRYGNMNHPILKYLTRWVCEQADALVLLTSYQHSQLRQIGVTRNQIYIVPFGVEEEYFATRPKTMTKRAVRFLHVGSIIPVKDHETLLRAFKRISEKIPCELRLVGVDYLNGKIQKLVHEFQLNDKVTFAGYVPYNDIKEHYVWADILLHTSYHEAQGLVIVEAAISNVLICGTNVGLLAEFSPDKALTVDVGDDEALAAKVLDLLNNPERMETMRQNASVWANTHTLDWTTKQIQSIYHRFLFPHSEENNHAI